jgi:hypothetical protein
MTYKSRKSKCKIPLFITIILIIGFIIIIFYIGYIVQKRQKDMRIQQLIKGDKFVDVSPPNTTLNEISTCAQMSIKSLQHIVSKVFGLEYNIEYLNDNDFIIYVNLLGESTLDDDGKHVLTINGDKLYSQLKDIDDDNQKWRAIHVDKNGIDIFYIVPLKSIANITSVTNTNPITNILKTEHPAIGTALQFEHGYLSLRKKGEFENQYWFIQPGQKRFRNDKFHVQTFTEDPGKPNIRQMTLVEEHQDKIGNILYLINNNINHYDNISNNKGKNILTNDNSLNLIMDLHGFN